MHDNIRKVVAWTLPTNGGEALTVIAALLFGLVLPMTAARSCGQPGRRVGARPGARLRARRAGRHAPAAGRPDEPLLSRFLVWRVVVVSLLFAAASLGMFFAALELGRDLETARTIVVNALVVLQVFYLFNVRYLHDVAHAARGARHAGGAVGTRRHRGGAAAVHLRADNAVLVRNAPLAFLDGAVVIACGAVFMFLLEAEKLLLRRFGLLEQPPSGTPAPESSRAG